MSTPLSLLREYTIHSKQIVEREGKIVFGTVEYPRDIKTDYLIYGSGENGKKKEYYSLECLLFLLKNSSLKWGYYAERAVAENILPVSCVDRKYVLAYLKGKVEAPVKINTSSPSRSAAGKTPSGSSDSNIQENGIQQADQRKHMFGSQNRRQSKKESQPEAKRLGKQFQSNLEVNEQCIKSEHMDNDLEQDMCDDKTPSCSTTFETSVLDEVRWLKKTIEEKDAKIENLQKMMNLLETRVTKLEKTANDDKRQNERQQQTDNVTQQNIEPANRNEDEQTTVPIFDIDSSEDSDSIEEEIASSSTQSEFQPSETLETSINSEPRRRIIIKTEPAELTPNVDTGMFSQVAQIIWANQSSVLSHTDFLNARLVCRSWRRAIESINDGPCKTLQILRSVTLITCCWEYLKNRVKQLEIKGLASETSFKILSQKCPKDKMHHKGNWSWKDPDRYQGKEAITRMLKLHGNNIIEFELSQGSQDSLEPSLIESGSEDLNWHSTLAEWLTLMPNLKECIISDIYQSAYFGKRTGAITQMQQNVSVGMINFKYLQFPKGYVPASVIRHVLLTNPQITILNLCRWQYSRHTEVPNLDGIALQHLNELSITVDSDEKFECLQQLNAPFLQILELQLYTSARSSNCTSIISNVLEKFRMTLVHVLLTFLLEPLDSYKFPEMPNLQKLTLILKYSTSAFKTKKIFSKIAQAAYTFEKSGAFRNFDTTEGSF